MLKGALDKLLVEYTDTAIIGSLLERRSTGRSYIDELFRLKCAPDLMATGAFPNGKELTESFGAYHAMWKYLRILGEPDWTVVVVGDGAAPRTGLVFAYRAPWLVLSVDPRLRIKKKYEADRLYSYPCRVEDFPKQAGRLGSSKLLIVAVHSHANLDASLEACRKMGVFDRIAVIAIPCCVKQEIEGVEPSAVYSDSSIWSPERTVKIWKNVPLKQEDPATKEERS